MTQFLKQHIEPLFSKELPSDPIESNYSRQVAKSCFSFVETKKPTKPEILHQSSNLMSELNLEIEDQDEFTKIMSGEIGFQGFRSYAMFYGGHQFGQWAGQLGDGRAINIAELDLNNKNWKFQLKGSGPTPYSRGSDGLAVLRSSIREYLCSEAMQSLGVPTTRALSLAKTGDLVMRDILYNGNPAEEHGAIVCRVSPSFIRFGSFEIFTSRGDHENLKKLVDFTIKHHFPEINELSKIGYIQFFQEVVSKTKDLIIHWQRVGFVHGVMNTDNMSILGLTIDYGPYGWLEDYNPFWTPNTTDAQNKRYRFGNQASMALWNLTQLANAIYPLIQEVDPLQDILENFKDSYLEGYHTMMCQKLGLYESSRIHKDFISDLEENMTRSEIDYTLFFRELSEQKTIQFKSFWEILLKTTYLEEKDMNLRRDGWGIWFDKYSKHLTQEGIDADRIKKMKSINPKYVLRNYMAQLAIDDANKGDYKLIDELYQLLSKPYDDQVEMNKWYAKRPEWARHKVGCSMLSCSS